MSAPDLLVLDEVCKTFVQRATLTQRLAGKQPRGTQAVSHVSLTVRRGEIFGLVGESGCGKSTLARVVAGLIKPTGGAVHFSPDQVSGRAPRLQMIFQDPFSSLNGRWTVERIIAEPIVVHRLRRGAAVRARVNQLLEQVGLSPDDAGKYPQEFSGGQRQRISIARALAGEPDFLILDEPTSALDVSVQAQVLNLLRQLQSELHLTCLFITHNLSVVRLMADRMGVMYLGQLVEEGDTQAVFEQPRHPYTRLLIDAAPDLDVTDRSLNPIAGELPSPASPPSGCRFHTRCPRAQALCASDEPQPIRWGADETLRCHFPLSGPRERLLSDQDAPLRRLA